jgi:hypothetical protein
MLRALSVPTHPIDRHHLLQQTVKSFTEPRGPATPPPPSPSIATGREAPTAVVRTPVDLRLTRPPPLVAAEGRAIAFQPAPVSIRRQSPQLLTEVLDHDVAALVVTRAWKSHDQDALIVR